MKASGDRFQILGVVVLMGLFAGGFYTGHRQSGHWPIPDGLILASLALYAFLLVRRAEAEASRIDGVVLGAMVALAALDSVILATDHEGAAREALKVLPLLALTIYLGALNIHRRKAIVLH